MNSVIIEVFPPLVLLRDDKLVGGKVLLNNVDTSCTDSSGDEEEDGESQEALDTLGQTDLGTYVLTIVSSVEMFQYTVLSQCAVSV